MNKDFTFGAVSGALLTLVLALILALSGLIGVGGGSNSAGPVAYGEPTGGDYYEEEPQEVKAPEITSDDWIFGNPDAKISIVEFSDIDCPFCASLHPTLEEVVKKYPNDVNWVYRHFPLGQIHPEAEGKAIASECVGAEYGNDTFWKYLSGLFTSQSSNEVIEEAEKLGLDTDKLKSCLADRTYADDVAEDFQSGVEAGTTGTPNSVIVFEGQALPVSGALPFDQFDSIITGLLEN